MVRFYLLSSCNVGQYNRGVWNIITSSSAQYYFCYLSSGQLNKYTNQAKESILRTQEHYMKLFTFIQEEEKKNLFYNKVIYTLKRGSCTIFIGQNQHTADC